jgi:hypothetical protein
MPNNNPTNPPPPVPNAKANNPQPPTNTGLAQVPLVRANRKPGSRHPFLPAASQNGKGRRTRRHHKKSRKTRRHRR